jgi:hypothetical protein
MMPLEGLDADRLHVGEGADLGRRRAHLLGKKAAEQRIVRPHDLVVGRRSPTVRKRLAEAVDQALGEGVECQRVETGGVAAMAARAHPRGEVGRGVALIADRQDALRRQRAPSLQEVGRTLRQQLRLARARPGDHRAVVFGTDDEHRVGLQLVDAAGAPVVGSYAAAEHSHGQSRRRDLATCARTSARIGGIFALRSFGAMCASAARCIAGLLRVRKW